MKESRYNYYLQDHTGMVIYNAMADEVVVLNPQLAAIYEEGRGAPEKIRNIHSDLFAYLTSKGVLIEDDVDEVKTYVAIMEEKDAREFTVTINPTLACNMTCWYCYENHKNMPAMSTKVKQATIAFIRNISSSESIKKLNLSLFGGEPLLCFENIILDIINEAVLVCREKNIALSIHFTTNAYLLTESVLEHLSGLDVSFQITIDGNETVHNSVKRTKNDERTYSTIIEHIYLALSKGFSVGVRFNYTEKTLPAFIDVLSDFQNASPLYKRLLNFTFHRVWQDDHGDSEQIIKQVAELEHAFEEAGLFVNAANNYAVPYCYADRRNTAVINYNGDLYKCTARDFKVKNREGILTSEGGLKWNEKYNKRMAIRYGNDLCRECRIFPICHGGCSQAKIENPIVDSCPKGYNEENKEEIMRGRALFILEQCKKRIAAEQ